MGAELNKTEIREFQRLLRQMLAEVEQNLQPRDDIAIDNAPDSIDRVQFAGERDLAIRRIESHFTRTQSIRLALERIEEGSYGACIACDGMIGKKRLQALPWAAYCIRCQEAADRGRLEHGGERFEAAAPVAEPV